MNGFRIRGLMKLSGTGLLMALLMLLAACSDSKKDEKSDNKVDTAATATAEVTEAATEVSVPDVADPTEAPTAVTEQTSNEVGDTAGDPAQTSEGGVWTWHEWGLEMTYPAGWQGILTDAPFVFVIAGPADESGHGPYVAVQAGAYDTSKTFREFMEELTAADNVTLSDIIFGGIEGVGFETTNDANSSRFVAIPYPEGQVMLVGEIAATEEWDTWSPVMDEIIASAIIAPLELDEAALNEQMQASIEATGLMTVGDPEAPLWVAEFMDFSCPHCFEYTGTMDRLVQDYVVTGKAQFTLAVLDFVGGPASTLAAKYQICGAKLGVGWTMHNLIFAAYGKDQAGRNAYTEENLAAVVEAAELDIDQEALTACLADEATAAIITSNLAWADAVEVNSTPNVLVGTTRDDVKYLSAGGQDLKGGYPLYYIYPALDTLLKEMDSAAVPSTSSNAVFGG
ncbi:MAG: thioredoxin domain-containing protein [Chloroflexi bacterium]|nr:thioredoxin domain-containing protein [Chloroflexota bacterium]